MTHVHIVYERSNWWASSLVCFVILINCMTVVLLPSCTCTGPVRNNMHLPPHCSGRPRQLHNCSTIVLYFKFYMRQGLFKRLLMSFSRLLGSLYSCCFDEVWIEVLRLSAPPSVVDAIRPTSAAACVGGILALTCECRVQQQMSSWIQMNLT